MTAWYVMLPSYDYSCNIETRAMSDLQVRECDGYYNLMPNMVSIRRIQQTRYRPYVSKEGMF